MTFWIAGITLLATALGATVYRWQYQARQQRAFVEMATRELAREKPTSPAAVVAVAPLDPDDPAVAVIKQLDRPEPPLLEKPERETVSERVEREAIEREEDNEERSDAAADPSVVARIEIPRIGVAAIVREGADDDTLAKAVGLVPGTPRPGLGGNTVLAGHRDTFFRPLRKIKVDDRIRLVVPGNTYEYRVDSMRVVEPTETSVLQSKGVDELTLITCYPFRWIGSAPERYIVNAVRVE